MDAKIQSARRLRYVALVCVPWFATSLPSAIKIYVEGGPSAGDWLAWVQFVWPVIPLGALLGQYLDYLLTSRQKATN